MAVDVTRDNFAAVLPQIADAISRCTFMAVDCEMTGLFTEAKHEFLDDMQARYSKVSRSAQNYLITQYGLSCFERTGPASWQASTWNVYLFPVPHGPHSRRFLCDAGSLHFLAQHGFDFNATIHKGVPFMPIRSRDWQLAQANRSDEPRPGNPVVPSAPEDVRFVDHLRRLVTDWLAGGPADSSELASDGAGEPGSSSSGSGDDNEADSAGGAAGSGGSKGPAGGGATQQPPAQQQQQALGVSHELALPPLNAYRRLLAFQELRKLSGFWVKRLEDSRCLVLVRATPEQAELLAAQAKAAKLAGIRNAAGFAAVFEAMRDSGKPVVVHNGLFDVAYGLCSFADSFVPASWAAWKQLAAAWHPGGVYDTKYLTKQLPEVFEGATSLAEVYAVLTSGERSPGEAGRLLGAAAAAAAAAAAPGDSTGAPAASRSRRRSRARSVQQQQEQGCALPAISHAPGFDKYRALAPGEAAHEAGYDAFMTGAAFACLLPLVARKIAAEPSCELARAHADAAAARQEAAAAAAAAAAAGAAEQLPSGVAGSDGSLQPGQQALGDALWPVAGTRGRLNVTFSDLPYAALEGPDPIPPRPCVFHLAGLAPGFRPDELWRLLQRQGLGTPRITPLDSTSALAEFAAEVVPAVLPTLLGRSSSSALTATPWAEWAAQRASGRLTPGEAAHGAGGAGGEDVAALPLAAAADASRPSKRPRSEEQAAEEEVPQARSMCVVM